ncbi:myrosinase 1-like [Bombyx mandarina]|uniref:Cytosolic beta-glucosidase n=2 Tax=Bombyx TaxID=7090 RepID=A0A8R2R4L7_BOMMO|nr:myrosinase 1-like [Bombyx mandarina]XP_037876582.1 myrosinase 1 [Bombyx mori]
MKFFLALGFLVVCCSALSTKQQRRFPDDFLIGTATASYQIEGAWNEDGKGENIWDYLTHNNPAAVKDGSTGDIAANSYHNVERDVEMMRELGLDVYRFSLSWSRILPSGFANEINEAGVDYYNRLINEMLKYGITPMITLFHWDLPQKLQELGGFANPLASIWFEDYARVVYTNFGDRVKHWITINEPREICYEGYGSVHKAPILNATAIGTYLCAKNVLIAHAKAYHLYNNEFKDKQGGQCGITISANSFRPFTDSEEDHAATELRRQAEFGLYAEPIFSEEGGFPKELVEIVAEKSAKEGYPWSRIPEFTDEERELVRGASDFFGVNHYTGFLVSANEQISDRPTIPILPDITVGNYIPPEWPQSASYWLTLSPDSIYDTLTYLQKRYNDPIFYITENGWSSPPTNGLLDDDRIRYYRAALESVLDCLDAGIRLKGYMAWSLMDNFEWLEGYTERFGLYEVDFSDPARPRTPRKSAFVYKEILRSRVIDHDYEPNTTVMTIDEGH